MWPHRSFRLHPEWPRKGPNWSCGSPPRRLSTVTTTADWTLSRGTVLASGPNPSTEVSPPIPTVGHPPITVARPNAASPGHIHRRATCLRTNYAFVRRPRLASFPRSVTTRHHALESGGLAPTAHRHGQTLASAKIEPCNVSGAGAAHDYRRLPIVGVIVDGARLIVRSVRRNPTERLKPASRRRASTDADFAPSVRNSVS
jgi:hypothetical protein